MHVRGGSTIENKFSTLPKSHLEIKEKMSGYMDYGGALEKRLWEVCEIFNLTTGPEVISNF